MSTRLELVDDAEILREVVRHQAAEIEKLRRELRKTIAELAQALGGERQLAMLVDVERKAVELETLRRKVFGDSSEQRRSTIGADEAPEDKAPVRRGHGPRPQPALPTREVRHELPLEQRACPSCDGTVTPMGDQTEDAEEIDLIERRYVVVTHRRQKYRCRCNAAVVTAPAPRKLVAGGRYSVDVAVDVAVAKYADHLPLDRQARIMGRLGLAIDSQTLWDQIDALADHLAPTYAALHARALADDVVHADETWWRLLDRKAATKWWAWCLVGRDSVVYRIVPSRSAEAARGLLDGYEGVVVADGYGAYAALARGSPRFVLAHCWAHVRRKFVELESFYPEESAHVLGVIGRLYRIDKLAGDPRGTSRRDLDWVLDERRHARDVHLRPLIDGLRDWAYAQRAPRESALRKAVEYMLGLWPGLVRFLDDPRVPLDNNVVERALRGAVVGRKNHYGSRSKRGTEVAALFYSLLETARLCGEDEVQYLRRAAYAAIDQPATVTLPVFDASAAA